jgi:hypothetical protein
MSRVATNFVLSNYPHLISHLGDEMSKLSHLTLLLGVALPQRCFHSITCVGF